MAIGINLSYLDEQRKKNQTQATPVSSSSPASTPKPIVNTASNTDEKKKPTFWQRIKNIGEAGVKQSGGSYVGAFATADELMDSSGTKEESLIASTQQSQWQTEKQQYIDTSAQLGKEPDESVLAWYDEQIAGFDVAQEQLSQRLEKEEQRRTTSAETASRLMSEGIEAQEEAKEGLDKSKAGGYIGSLLVDGSVAGIQMVMDTAVGALTGTGAAGSKAAMMTRAFGSAATQSAMNGGDISDQMYEGVKSAALEYFTEKLFGGNPVYDDGGIITNALYKMADAVGADSAISKALSSIPAKMLYEGLEEVSVGVLDPLVNRFANWLDGGARETDMPNWKDLVYEGAIGALLGGTANVLTGNVGSKTAKQTETETEAQTEQSAEVIAEAEIEKTAQDAAESVEALPPESYTPEVQRIVKQAIDGPTAQPSASPVTFDPVAALAGVQNIQQTAPQTITQEAQTSPEQAAQTTEQQAAFDPVSYMASPATQTQETESAQAQEAVVTPDMAQIVQDAILNRQPIRSAPAVLMNGQTQKAAAQPIADTAAYDRMIAETPESQLLPVGESPARDFRAPVQSADGNLQSLSFRTIGEAETTSPQMAAILKEGFADGLGSRVGDTNRAQVDRAVESVMRHGYKQSATTFIQNVDDGKADADTVAMGAVLIKAASDSGATQDFVELFKAYSTLATRVGRAVQAQRIYKQLNSMMEGFVATLTPQDRLSIMQNSVLDYNENLRKRFPNGVPVRYFSRSIAADIREAGIDEKGRAQEYELFLDPVLTKQFLSAETEEDRNKISAEIIRDLGRQAPSTWQEKLSSWRYFSMLFNPRTHVKNIVSNAATWPVRAVKDLLRVGLEKAFIRDSADRTITTVNPSSPGDKALLAHAKILYGDIEGDIMETGKWENKGASAIDRSKSVFNRFAPLEKLSSFNTNALTSEDRWFSRPAFTTAFAAGCKVRGITASDIQSGNVTQKVLDEITARSIDASRKATFREMSQLADFMNRITTVRPGDKPITKAAKTAAGVVFPFRSTPSNIATQAFEYSPFGLGKSIWDMCTKVRRGDMSAAQAIDEFAAGFTGTALLGVGVLLGSMGKITGGEDEDQKQQAFNELQGWQGYSIVIGNEYYSIENLGLGAIPLLVGVEMNRILNRDYETTVSGTLEALSNITDPIFEMTMLSSVTDLLENLSYADGHYLREIATSIATSFVGQLFPTLGGAIERTFTEDRVNSTFIDRTASGGTLSIGDRNIDLPFLQGMENAQYALGSIANKIPGVEYNQIPRVDAWGRQETTGDIGYRAFANFALPGYVSADASTSVDSELQRLYETGIEGSSGVFPTKASQSIKVSYDDKGFKRNRYLSADEFVTYQGVMGSTSLNTLNTLMSSSAWDSYTDEQKIDIISHVYDYARAIARQKVEPRTSVDSWITEADDIRNIYSMSVPEYIAASALYGTAFLKNETTQEVVSAGATLPAYHTAYNAIGDLPPAPEYTNVASWQKMIYISRQNAIPEAAKEAYYAATMQGKTYDTWLTAKGKGKTIEQFCAEHYDKYAAGDQYVGGPVNPFADLQNAFSGVLSAPAPTQKNSEEAIAAFQAALAR